MFVNVAQAQGPRTSLPIRMSSKQQAVGEKEAWLPPDAVHPGKGHNGPQYQEAAAKR